MTESASGIILRTRPLTETSLIVHWLTPELGRVATVAKGARRPKSPFAGKLDLFYSADFSFTRSRRSELHTLREAGLLALSARCERAAGRVTAAAASIARARALGVPATLLAEDDRALLETTAP